MCSSDLAARTGAIPAARKDLARLATLKEAMTTAKIGYWPEQTDFQMKAIEAWVALEEKQPERALQLMRISADAEAAGDKHPVTPGGVVPMRELLAEMLLQLDQPGPALAEFERSLAREPNRHLAFAFGIHTCAGMNLARLEARVALGKFLARFPNFELDGEPVRGGRARFRGFLHLPCRIE